MRPTNPKSRHHRKTENEIALEWELKRLRAELTATQKELRDAKGTDGFGQAPGDYLRGQGRALFFLKIERLYRRSVQDYIPKSERCRCCGAASWFQLEHAFFEACHALPDWNGTLDPDEWRLPDELPHPEFDFARGVVPSSYQPPDWHGHAACGGEPAPRDWSMPEGCKGPEDCKVSEDWQTSDRTIHANAAESASSGAEPDPTPLSTRG